MKGLPIWVIYDHPKDYPDCYVARLWEGETPTDRAMYCADLATLRRGLERMGLVKLMRQEGDDPVIVETWL